MDNISDRFSAETFTSEAKLQQTMGDDSKYYKKIREDANELIFWKENSFVDFYWTGNQS